MRSTDAISHRLDGWAEVLRPARDARVQYAVRQALTPDGRVRLDRVAGFLAPQAIAVQAIETGVLVDLDPPSIPAGGAVDLLVAVADAQENDGVVLGPPLALAAGLMPIGFVSATGVVTIRIANHAVSAVNPASGSWRIVLVR